jgi:hypothetical protein
MMKSVSTYETLVNFYETTQHNAPEDSPLPFHFVLKYNAKTAIWSHDHIYDMEIPSDMPQQTKI